MILEDRDNKMRITKPAQDRNGPDTVTRDVLRTENPAGDLEGKAILRNRQVFSLILQATYQEYSLYPIDRISRTIQDFISFPDDEPDSNILEANPVIEALDQGKAELDALAVIRKMDSEELQFINVELQGYPMSPDRFINRVIAYLARVILAQRSHPLGMKKGYRGLKAIKVLWILPVTGYCDILNLSLSGSVLKNTPELKEMLAGFEGKIDIRIVFIDSEWENSDDETIRTLAHIFRNRDREAAIRYLEQKGVNMTADVKEAADSYYNMLFTTLTRKERDRVDHLVEELEKSRQDQDRLRAALDHVQAASHQMEKELDQAQAATHQMEKELGQAQAATRQMEQELGQAQAAARQMEKERDQAQDDMRRMHRELEALRKRVKLQEK